MLDRISVEVTNRCAKACSFCYAASGPDGGTSWTADELVGLALDCAKNGVRALSLGGGEPLQAPATFVALERLDGVMFRSITTNGLLLDGPAGEALVRARPDKVHVSIHFPDDGAEVERVIRQVRSLSYAGIRAGVNLVVARSRLAAARRAFEQLVLSGIGNDRVVVLPMRGNDGEDTPTPREVAWVALDEKFQSMSCLSACGKSERFCSITWDKRVAWCSYTSSKRPLSELSYAGIERALGQGHDALALAPCGGAIHA